MLHTCHRKFATALTWLPFTVIRFRRPRLDLAPTRHLAPLDNRQNPTALQVHQKSSKTDQFQQGTALYIDRTYNSLCPVIAIEVPGSASGPFFRWENGSPLTRPVERVRQALSQNLYLLPVHPPSTIAACQGLPI